MAIWKYGHGNVRAVLRLEFGDDLVDFDWEWTLVWLENGVVVDEAQIVRDFVKTNAAVQVGLGCVIGSSETVTSAQATRV